MIKAHSFNEKINEFHQRTLAIIIDDYTTPSHAAILCPASKATPELVNFLISHTTGLSMVALSPERTSAFMLSKMTRPSTTVLDSSALYNMTISVEAREGVTTGISAYDRSQTLQILGEDIPSHKKLVSPGHIFPVECRTGGVLVRPAIPEGALDLVKRAHFTDAACFIDLLDEGGNYLCEHATHALHRKYEIPIFTLTELTQQLLSEEKLIERIAEARLPSRFGGDFKAIIYHSSLHGGEHVALVKGEINSLNPVLTRVQTESTFFDVFGGSHGGSKKQLEIALQRIGESEQGVLVYLRKPEGLLRDQILQSQESRTTSMHQMREFGVGAQILRDLGATSIELLTNTKKNIVGLSSFGIEIVKTTPLSAVIHLHHHAGSGIRHP